MSQSNSTSLQTAILSTVEAIQEFMDSRVGQRTGPILLILTIVTAIVAVLTVRDLRSSAIAREDAELATASDVHANNK